MVLHNNCYRFFFLLFFGVFSSAYADILLVPEAFPSLHDAIKQAKNSDIISLKTGGYESSDIQIERMKLTISGRDESSPVHFSAKQFESHEYCMNIINSTILFNNIRVSAGNTLTGWPSIVIEDSDVSFENCVINGNPGFGGAAGGDSRCNTPAMVFKNCVNRSLDIQNCTLTTMSHRQRTGNPIGALVILNCSNCHIDIIHSVLYGADCIEAGGHFNDVFTRGGPAITLSDCELFSLRLTDSILYGGKSCRGHGWWRSGTEPYSSPPSAGSSGLWINRSIGSIQDGTIYGGNGGDGWFQNYGGAQGGTGLHAERSSRIIVKESILIGGKGGEPNGKSGDFYYSDETSFIHYLYGSGIQRWKDIH